MHNHTYIDKVINKDGTPGYGVDKIFQDSRGYYLEGESPETNWRRSITFSTIRFGAYRIGILLTRLNQSSGWVFTHATSDIWTPRGWLNVLTAHKDDIKVPSFESTSNSSLFQDHFTLRWQNEGPVQSGSIEMYTWTENIIAKLYLNSMNLVRDFTPSLLPESEG